MEETVEQMVKRIMETPVDRNKPYVFRYYKDSRQPDKPALWVVLGARRFGSAITVVHGRQDFGWREGKLFCDAFCRDKMEWDIHDGMLLTEAEAREAAESMGLNIDIAKAKMVSGFTEYNKYSPNIVADDEKALLAHREEASAMAKKIG